MMNEPQKLVTTAHHGRAIGVDVGDLKVETALGDGFPFGRTKITLDGVVMKHVQKLVLTIEAGRPPLIELTKFVPLRPAKA